MKRSTPSWRIALISGIGLSLVLFGFFWVKSRNFTKSDNPKDLISRFLLSNRPLTSFNLGDEFPGRKLNSLFKVEGLLPTTDTVDYHELSAILKYSKYCDQAIPSTKSPALQKELEWSKWKCKKIPQLPENFFRKEPWIHPLGDSYVYLALKADHSPYAKNLEWQRQNQGFAHVLEWRELPLALTDLQKVFADLSPEKITSLSEGNNTIDQDLVFLRSALSNRNDFADYSVFKRLTWDTFAAKAGYQVSTPNPGSVCPHQVADFCWQKLNEHRDALFLRMSGVLLFATLALCLGLLALWIRQVLHQHKLGEKQRFAFLMLAHELRTPLSTLKLELSALREQEKQLPPFAQTALLKAYDSTERLRRLSEMSLKYLKASGPKLIDLNLETIPSLKNFIGEIVGAYQDSETATIVFQSDIPDSPFVTDPYWLAFCIENLLQNALKYGKAPIKVSLKEALRRTSIIIEDEGELLDEHLKSFLFEQPRSQSGLGLGVSLVQKVVREMGYELQIYNRPTRFCILLARRS